MRRRPIEIWWITAFSLFTAARTLPLIPQTSGADQIITAAYASVLPLAALLLIALTEAGRWAAFIAVGVAAVDNIVTLTLASSGWHARLSTLGFTCFCLWMMIYLQSLSTRRVCSRNARIAPSAPYSLSATLLDLMETFCGVGTVLALKALNFGDLAAVCTGFASFVFYGVVLDERVRRGWSALFQNRGGIATTLLSRQDLVHWRAACKELQKQDFRAARGYAAALSPEAQRHPDCDLFLQMLDWHEAIYFDPTEGEACLQRVALDHDWKPDEIDRKRLQSFAECASETVIRKIIDQRTRLIEGLVAAAANPGSYFYVQTDRVLSRITGETFGFNAIESWNAWWQNARNDWSGDAGAVSLVARLLRLDPPAANALAKRIAGRAEEPLLRELTAQVVFLNAMHKAIRDHGGVEPFIRQPQRMLLVPELTDAVGLLHTDSQLLENLGMSLNAVARRLQVRVQLVDYIGKLWARYPDDLGTDMPWLFKTLTGKNLGVLRARAKFESWWPRERELFLRHDKAMAAGLNAHAAGDQEGEEKAFREALDVQPRGLSSRYNLALCLMRRNQHSEAAQLMRELIQLEPKEPFWWIVLGVMHRSVNETSDAHAAFRKALELGAAAPRVALHIGLTFARDRRDAEAIKQLDRALGKNPTASRIEALVSHLENEGLWSLAGHYREVAFRKGLSSDGGGAPDSEEDVAA
ncbi:MAG TPA: tetratricopeptide repeat protein [Planctomycetota bacterium]|nr:tetratricopeptide repeat protein [Planctomycetota bacterium]